MSDERSRGRTAAAAGDAAADGCTVARVAGTAVVRARTASHTTGTGTADRTAAGTTETAVSDRYRYAAVQLAAAAVVHCESRTRALRLCDATAAVGKPLTGNVFVASSRLRWGGGSGGGGGDFEETRYFRGYHKRQVLKCAYVTTALGAEKHRLRYRCRDGLRKVCDRR